MVARPAVPVKTSYTAAVSATRGRRLIDGLGLTLLLLALLDLLRPELLLLPTLPAGGDLLCHYPTAVFVRDTLLPQGRVHGWSPGAYLGHPLLLYYFPLPFWLMAGLAPLTGLPVAFKLVVAAGVLLLPLCAYAALRLVGAAFPGPLLGAAAAFVFLLVEDNPIWGGTLASTLAGEFSYTWGTGLALLFLGLAARAQRRGSSAWPPAAALALTALAHGYAVLFAGLASTGLMLAGRRPGRTLRFLLAIAAGAFALAGAWLLPLLADWRWTTPYSDPWILVGWRNLLPPLLWPLFAAALGGLLAGLRARRPGEALEPALLLGWQATLVAGALALAGPRLGLVHVRFVPFAQLALALLGGLALARLVAGLRASGAAALGLCLLAVVHGEAGSQVARAWVEWDFAGLEARPLWPAFRRLADTLRAGVGDPRVAVEYSREHEQAGSIRAYELLPFLSGRSTLEGVYNQASLSSPAAYHLASQLSPIAPNPYRSLEYSDYDLDGALATLRLYNVSHVVAVSEVLKAGLAERPELTAQAGPPPYHVYRLRDAGPGYVEPLAFAPRRAAPGDWRPQAYRWLTRRPRARAHLLFSDDARLGPALDDPWLGPPEQPLGPLPRVASALAAESLRLTTDRPGHPLLVKLSYHPRWRAEGADGPYLASPALMVVVPRQREVVLRYVARTWSDHAGLALSGLALLAWARSAWRRRRGGVAGFEPPGEGGRWGAFVPVGLVALVAAAGLLSADGRARRERAELAGKATAACQARRHADAADYAHQAAERAPEGPARDGLSLLEAESLLAAGEARDAARLFGRLVGGPATPQLARALAGAARARAAAGDDEAAELYRVRLAREFPGWTAPVPPCQPWTVGQR